MTVLSAPFVRYAAICAGFALAIWLVLAWTSGLFMSRNDVYAVPPGEFTHDGFSEAKKIVKLKDYTVAYYEAGEGPPLILLHGCPFSAFEWHRIIPDLARHFHVVAPDLLGFGDTPVKLDDDYRLPHDADMVRQLMDHFGWDRASFIGHDHGGATILLLMQADPDRIEKAVLTNIEAYDMWPSEPEKPYLHLIVNPVSSPVIYFLFKTGLISREAFGLAFHDPGKTMTDKILAGFARPNLATRARWQRLRRMFRWQLDKAHNQLTMKAVPAMRRFKRPVGLFWGRQDDNFGPAVAKRLLADIPGATSIVWFENSGHMPMLEEPGKYAREVIRFLNRGPSEGQRH